MTVQAQIRELLQEYGWLSVVLAMKHLEEMEEYSLCSEITKFIEEYNLYAISIKDDSLEAANCILTPYGPEAVKLFCDQASVVLPGYYFNKFLIEDYAQIIVNQLLNP